MKPRRTLRPSASATSSAKQPVTTIPLGAKLALLFLVIALPGYLVTLALAPDPEPRPTQLQRKVAGDLQREDAARSEAVSESLERIRQSP
jgi:hypothetical protein